MSSAATPMIRVQGFTKTFYVGFRRKPSVAAREISFEVQPGEIFGFLGPNGAGKTTTIKALLGLVRADGGTLEIVGHPPHSRAWRREVGYMPEHPTFYDYLSGLEVVTWFARLGGMAAHEAEQEARRLLGRVGLAHAMTRRLRGYSKGMLQRAGLAQALVGSPSLLILDEPMTGLDPIGRRDIRELITSLRDEGKTVFYSTHILPDVEMTCDRVSMLQKGRSVRTGRLDEILDQTTRGVEVVLSGVSAESVQATLREHPTAKVGDGKLQVGFEDRDRAWAFTQQMIAAGATLQRFEPHRDSLEEIFVRSLGSAEEASA